MKRSKARIAPRLLVEKLESRLQPGSIITGQGYGWSLLAGNLSVLDQSSLEAPSLVSQASSEASKPAQSSAPVETSSHALDLAVVPVVIAKSETSSVPSTAAVDDLAIGFTNADVSGPAVTDHLRSVPLAALATAAPHMPAPATPVGSVAHSPTGVAAPAMPAASNARNGAAVSGPVGSASPDVRSQPAHANPLDKPTPRANQAALQPRTDLHLASLTSGSFSPFVNHGNQAAINFLTYLGGGAFPSGGTGADSINSVAVQQEHGTNFIYLAGSITDSTGRQDGFAAKLTGDGSSVVWVSPFTQHTAGPDTGLGIAVNSNNVYLTGNLADPQATPQTDGFIAQLDPNTGALGATMSVPGATLAAVTTDSAGNVYFAGSVPDDTNSGQNDIVFYQTSSDLATTNYASPWSNTINNGMVANSAVTTGNALAVDSSGNLYFAGSIGVVGDPNNETFPFYGRLNATGTNIDWQVYYSNVTPGPGGMGTAVALDQNGNVVVTGSLNDNGSNTDPSLDQGPPTLLNQDLLLVRIAQTPDPAGNANVIDNSYWFVDDRSGNSNRVGDWTGNAIVVLPDGSTIVTGAAYDPAAGTGNPASMPTKGIDVHVTHFTSDDMNTTQNSEGDPENVFGGTGADVGNGLALDPTTTTSPYNVYVVGSTSSTDLPTTHGVVEQMYNGTSTTGFAGQVSVT